MWLNWGGLATIDKNHYLFQKKHTGANDLSYHRGDSWYWLNNLAAIVMYRVNKIKYRSKINKILEASVNDLLWMGAVGCSSEISSAEKQTSDGCLNQAWSNAMLIELLDEVKL